MDSAALHVLNPSAQTAYARTVCVVCVCICLYLLANTHFVRVHRVSGMQSEHPHTHKKNNNMHTETKHGTVNVNQLASFKAFCLYVRTNNDCTE